MGTEDSAPIAKQTGRRGRARRAWLLALTAWASCVGPPATVCAPGSTRCAGTLVERCRLDGSGWERQSCAHLGSGYLCVQGEDGAGCKQALCSPGTRRCRDGLAVEVCHASGQEWMVKEACDSGAGRLCLGDRCQDACAVEAGTPQNQGCRFLPVTLDNVQLRDFGVVVSNPYPYPVAVTLRNRAGSLLRKVLPGMALASFVVPPDNVFTGTGLGHDYAFELSSRLPVAAFQFNPLSRAGQSSVDASMLIPTSAAGRRYRVFSAPVTSAGASQVAVVGIEDGTEVKITPSTDLVTPPGFPPLRAGATAHLALGARDLIQLAAGEPEADLTGTLVEASKPVLVFGANGCVCLPDGAWPFCNHVEEQMLPLEAWGKRYVAVKFTPRAVVPESDWWRIMASQDDTTVTISGPPPLAGQKKLDAGQLLEVETGESFLIEADKPIAVAHYLLGQSVVSKEELDRSVYSEPFETTEGCVTTSSGAAVGDPAMSMLVPLEQYRQSYVFLTPDTHRYDFVTITLAGSDEDPLVRLDGQPLPWTSFSTVTGTEIRYLRLRLADGPHRMEARVPFGIEVHGYDCNVSYAYAGGLDLRKINPIE